MVNGLFEAGTLVLSFANRLTPTRTGADTRQNIVCNGMEMGGKFLA